MVCQMRGSWRYTFVGAVPVLLVGGSDLGHAQARGAALRQQFCPVLYG